MEISGGTRQFVQKYRGRGEHMAWSGELKVVELSEVGKSKRANEGEKNC